MCDKQDGFALFGKASHNFHKFVNFLRRKYSRRFIKYEYIIITVEHFKNFYTLLHTYRNIWRPDSP